MNDFNATRPVHVLITDTKLTIVLTDGREISNPLEWFPWLQHATPEQQSHYELWHASVDWIDLDQGVDVEGMLRGIKPRKKLA